MNIENLFIPAGVFIGMLIGMLKYILWQNEKRMDFRFQQLEDARKNASENWDRRYGGTEQAMQDLTMRLTTVEANLKHMPTHQEIQKIATDLSGLQGETNTQTELLKRVDRQVTLINEWMMENK